MIIQNFLIRMMGMILSFTLVVVADNQISVDSKPPTLTWPGGDIIVPQKDDTNPSKGDNGDHSDTSQEEEDDDSTSTSKDNDEEDSKPSNRPDRFPRPQDIPGVPTLPSSPWPGGEPKPPQKDDTKPSKGDNGDNSDTSEEDDDSTSTSKDNDEENSKPSNRPDRFPRPQDIPGVPTLPWPGGEPKPPQKDDTKPSKGDNGDNSDASQEEDDDSTSTSKDNDEENSKPSNRPDRFPRPQDIPGVPNMPIPNPLKPPKSGDNPNTQNGNGFPKPPMPNGFPKPPKPEGNKPSEGGGENPTTKPTEGSDQGGQGSPSSTGGQGKNPTTKPTVVPNQGGQGTSSPGTTGQGKKPAGGAYKRGNEDAEKLPMDDEILGDKTTQGKEAYNMGPDPRAFNDNLGGYCLDKTYKAALGKDYAQITADRAEDWQYSTTDATCCCTSAILSLFKDHTKDMTDKRLNPAVDILMEALRNQRMSSDDKIKELVTLKYINTLYSFFDKDGKKMKAKSFKMPDEDGCIDTVTFKEPKDLTRKGIYREGILKETLGLLHTWRKSTEMAAEKNMIKMVK